MNKAQKRALIVHVIEYAIGIAAAFAGLAIICGLTRIAFIVLGVE